MATCWSFRRSFRRPAWLAACLSCLATVAWSAEPIDFARDVAPILRRSCWECHGAEKQEGGLRLDQAAHFQRGGDSGPVVAAGQPEASELIRRVGLPKEDSEVMPSRGQPLSKAEVARLRQWVEQGANWPSDWREQPHWAYLPPQRLPLPAVKQVDWPRSPIDYFVLARLEAAGLHPSPEADRPTWLRRVSLDLIGLPPTPEETRAFVADTDPLAFHRVVDRLLQSEQFGVRWARPWLDYARYADSHGFQRDDFRDLWPYRDWVVAAFNSDLPFDQFTIEQLAGDLIPHATEAQRIATGFHRNAPTNVEAGSDPEETRTNQIFDRVNTLGMVWLGTTLECAQCHDHKYDPFTMRDYYSLFACFNQTEIEADRANPTVPGSIRFLGPEMAIQDSRLSATRSELEAALADNARRRAERLASFQAPDAAWEAQMGTRISGTEPAEQSQPAEQTLPIKEFSSLGGATHSILDDHSVLLSGEAPDRDTYTIEFETKLTGIHGIKLETLTDPSLPGDGPGRGDEARPNFVLQDLRCEIAPIAEKSGEKPSPGQPVRFASARADFSQTKYSPEGAIDEDPRSAWAIGPRFGAPHWAVFLADAPFGFPTGTRLTIRLTQNFGAARTIGRLRISAVLRPDSVPSGKPQVAVLPADVAEALRSPVDQRTTKQRERLAEYRYEQDPEAKKLASEQRRLEAELKQRKPTTTLVMREITQPRETRVFRRGDFRSPEELVEPAVPAWFAKNSATPIRNRLDLARWLVGDENPLVARVAINRWWGELFGKGLVETPEDFGLKGEPPSHPELLDWLATEYRRRDWSLKGTLREIVLSATYRQSARVTAEHLAIDPQNRLLGRGPRGRLDAEAIRDQALAVAGLLSTQLGGPPVRPYQPEGLWVKVGGQKYEYEISPGDDAYRRGLYVVWKRAAPFPSFMNFDASSRLACRVRRAKTNTPLQALTLLNDPVYVEAAVALVGRVHRELPEAEAEERLRYLFQLALGRAAQPSELAVLRELLDRQRRTHLARPASAREFLASGAWRLPSSMEAAEFMGWYAVATAILNLDEVITKP